MRRLLSALVFALFSAVAIAATLSDAALDLMGNISRNAEDLRPLTFPRADVHVDREIEEFNNVARWIERDLAALSKLDATAAKSSTDVRGKPFAAQLKEALAMIETNRAGLKAAAAAKAESEAKALAAAATELAEQQVREKATADAKANMDAAAEVNLALLVAKNSKNSETFEGRTQAYDIYVAAMARAKSIDVRALKERKDEIAEVESGFVKRYLAEKAERDAMAEAETMKVAAAERAQQEAHEKEAKEARGKRNERAKALGFRSWTNSIVVVAQEVRDGQNSLASAKRVLIYSDGHDELEVQSLVGPHAIYASRVSSDETVQVAVVKVKGVFYGEGAPLPNGAYAIIGTASFQTILGVEKELLVLTRVE